MIAHIDKKTGKEQAVLEHLEETARLAEIIGSELHIGHLAYLTALLHDLGKWRKRFEDYLRAAVSGKKGAYRGSVNHSSAGAVYIYRRYYKGERIERLTAQLISMAIFSHHGLIDCVAPDGKPVFIERTENIQDIDYEEVLFNLGKSTISESYLDKLFIASVEEVKQFQNKIEELSDRIVSVVPEGREKIKRKAVLITYFHSVLERTLLSVLIDADRLNTAKFCNGRAENVFEKDKRDSWEKVTCNLEDYLKKFHGTDKISLLRTRIAEDCRLFAKKQEGIYRLSVPTGGAKTLSSFIR
ncbi:MAG: CRISPR-associated endonuclease Cas3'' [Clostridiales bacterium]|nr:CRISPR-associated endonuclease Cas3'' [Clostridiales bacterium]